MLLCMYMPLGSQGKNSGRTQGGLTHWDQDKMAAIFQTTFSNGFLWMKMYEFWLKFHWSLFLRVQLTISQHWFREWFGAGQVTSHYLNQCWPSSLTDIFGTRGRGVNTLALGRFEWNFVKVIFKQILVIGGWGFSCEISLRCFSQDLTNDKSRLVQVVAWCRQTISHYLNQCWPRSLTSCSFARPQSSQWVNTLRSEQNGCHVTDNIFKCSLWNENVGTSNKISLKYVTEGPINDKAALV